MKLRGKAQMNQVITVLLLTTVGFLFLFWFFNEKYYAPDKVHVYDIYRGKETIGERLVSGDRLEQTFAFDGELTAIGTKLWTITEDVNSGVLKAEVSENGEILAEGEYSLDAVKTIEPFRVELDRPLQLEPGKTYTVAFTVEDVPEESVMLFMGGELEAEPDAPASINGVQNENHSVLSLYGTSRGDAQIREVFSAYVLLMWGAVIICEMTFFLTDAKPRRFLVLAIVFCCLYQVTLPPLSVPDEDAHTGTTFYYSNRLFGVDEAEKVNTDSTFSWEFPVREAEGDLMEYDTKPDQETYLRLIGISREPWGGSGEIDTVSRGRVLKASPVSYLPQIIGVTLARLLRMNGFFTIYLGRLFSSAAYIAMAYFGIRRMPSYQTMLMLVALNPMTLHLAASYSYDSMSLGAAFLFLGTFLQLKQRAERIRMRDAAVLFLCALILTAGKGIYTFILGVCILLPDSVFAGKKKRVLAGAAAVVVLMFALNMLPSLLNDTAGSASVSEIQHYSIGYALQHPIEVIWMALNTLVAQFTYFLSTMLGGSLGWLELSMPMVMVFAYLALLGVSVLYRGDRVAEITKTDRLVYLGLFLLTGALCLAAALSWNVVPSDTINGVQGRYFLPVLPFLLLAAAGWKGIELKKNLDTPLLAAACALNFCTLFTVFNAVATRVIE